jgi:hypothetical protein
MRLAALFAGLIAAALQIGCAATPESLGITGPGQQAQPVTIPNDTEEMAPGVPDPGTGSGADQRYYHYN